MQKIIRKDGIEYERKNKLAKYDYAIHLKVSKETIEKLKTIAKEEGTKHNEIIRNLIDNFIEEREGR